MKLKTKIITLVILFVIKGIFYLIDGITTVSQNMTFADSSRGFINAVIMGFIAYVLYSKREKWIYWITIIFSGIIVVRFMIVIGSNFFLDKSILTTSLIWLSISNVLVFGIAPLMLLLTKDIRDYFFNHGYQREHQETNRE